MNKIQELYYAWSARMLKLRGQNAYGNADLPAGTEFGAGYYAAMDEMQDKLAELEALQKKHAADLKVVEAAKILNNSVINKNRLAAEMWSHGLTRALAERDKTYEELGE